MKIKRLLSALLLLFATITLNAQEFHIKGHVEGVANADLFTSVSGYDNDTIRIDKNGNFDFTAKVDKPQFAYFSIVEKSCSFILFVEGGTSCQVNIALQPAVFESEKYNKALLDIKGDNADCDMLYRDFSHWEGSEWPEDRVNATAFADYHKQVEDTLQAFRNRLAEVKSEAFKAIFGRNLSSYDYILMRYSWKHKAYDEDFAKWMNSFNRNNPKNMEFNQMYMRWYTTHHPKKEGQKQHEWYFGTLKDVFTNQEIINSMATGYMSSAIKSGDANMEELWDAFGMICTDTTAMAHLQASYEKAKKTMPGAQCEDFAMLDINDKEFHLSDLKGRAVFIDIWATWCGPCCMEIPHVEKLVEHYKNDSRIEFVSISFDSNRNAWVKKLEADKPAWKQFICNDEQKKALMDMFGISGIPRFLFIDKGGKIISGNAPRPSSKNIIEYIDEKIK